MNNPRMTPKERNLLKGSIRRVFSRSELRRAVIKTAIIAHSDETRKRVKTWCICAICKKPEAISNVQVDHLDPIVPLDSTLEDMDWDTVVDRTWCDIYNLQVVCKSCHLVKTKEERKVRSNRKKKVKKGKKR